MKINVEKYLEGYLGTSVDEFEGVGGRFLLGYGETLTELRTSLWNNLLMLESHGEVKVRPINNLFEFEFINKF